MEKRSQKGLSSRATRAPRVLRSSVAALVSGGVFFLPGHFVKEHCYVSTLGSEWGMIRSYVQAGIILVHRGIERNPVRDTAYR